MAWVRQSTAVRTLAYLAGSRSLPAAISVWAVRCPRLSAMRAFSLCPLVPIGLPSDLHDVGLGLELLAEGSLD
eukprot:8948677-Alexandrium_andersonii.AAC.1